MAYTVLVNGVDKTSVTAMRGTEVRLESNRRAVASVMFNDFRPEVGEPIGITDETGTQLFGGSIDEIEDIGLSPTHEARLEFMQYSCSCVSYEAKLDYRVTRSTDGRIVFGGAVLPQPATDSFFLPGHGLSDDQKVRFTTTDTLPTGLSEGVTYYVSDLTTDNFQISATAGGSIITLSDVGTGIHRVQWLAKDIITSVIADHADGDAITVGVECEDGSFVDAQSYSAMPVSAVLDTLAALSGFVWYLTPDRKVVFQSRSTDAAPFDITASEQGIRDLVYNETREDYHNTQFRRIAFEATDALSQTFAGDGALAHFHVNNPIARIDSITVDDVPQNVGVLGASGYDVVYEPGNQSIIFDSAPVNTAVIVVQYRELEADIVYLDDLTEVGARSTIESNSGRYEVVVDDTGNADAIGAISKTQADLDAHKSINGVLTYTTSRNGLRAGQYQSVTLSAHGLSSAVFVIDRIRCVPVNTGRMNYYVTALTGTKLTDLVEVFRSFGGTTTGGGSSSTASSPPAQGSVIIAYA